MVTYNPKLKTIFKRKPDFSLDYPNLASPYFSMVDPSEWIFTEKMDGRSVFFHADPGGPMVYYGRTPESEFNQAEQDFLSSTARDLTDRNNIENKTVALYAELIGPGVNGNSHNLDELELKFFDVRINDFWLNHDAMHDVLARFEVDPVPVASELNVAEDIYDAVENAAELIHLYSNARYFEGVIAKTRTYLYDNQGNRIIWKLKRTDLP